MEKERNIWLGLVRIALGILFFWAFFDKIFGLGFSTASGKAWLDGVSPTLGFLKFVTKGPFASLYQSLAGSPVVDWLFMLGLFCLGVALILGIGMRIAAISGTVLLLLMYGAALPPEHHPFLDEHIIYALLLLGLARARAGHFLGLGELWSNLRFVRKHPFLE